MRPKAPLRPSAGASLEVVLRAELGLVVSNSVRFGPVLVVFHKIKFRSGPVPVVFHKLKTVPVRYRFITYFKIPFRFGTGCYPHLKIPFRSVPFVKMSSGRSLGRNHGKRYADHTFSILPHF